MFLFLPDLPLLPFTPLLSPKRPPQHSGLDSIWSILLDQIDWIRNDGATVLFLSSGAKNKIKISRVKSFKMTLLSLLKEDENCEAKVSFYRVDSEATDKSGTFQLPTKGRNYHKQYVALRAIVLQCLGFDTLSVGLLAEIRSVDTYFL